MIPISQEAADFIKTFNLQNFEAFVKACEILGDELYLVNETTNLTAIPPEQFWTKHVADSLSVARAIPEICSWACPLGDIGCGAGFPSLVLAAAFPKLSITSIDSTLKKITFVEETASKMGLKNLRAEHGRGNEMGRQRQWRGRFKFMTARAVGALPKLLKETAALVSKEGVLAVYRTPKQSQEEFDALALNPAEGEGWKISSTDTFTLPGEAGQRNFTLCRKQ
jgi:16S rRNA (guanine527-N7)-methyltransferase